MKYLLIGFTMSIGWHIGIYVIETVYSRVSKAKGKEQIIPNTNRY